MLDFTHLREITNNMQVKSFAYAENFWQKIFDSIEFNEDKPISNWIFVGKASDWGIDLAIPDKADVADYFDVLKVQIGYSYFGIINVYFNYGNNKSHQNSNPYHTILTDVLLKNGFTQTDSEGLCFVRNINAN